MSLFQLSLQTHQPLKTITFSNPSMVKRSSILSSLNTPRNSSVTPTTVKEGKAYKGVRMRSWGSWVSEIRAPNQKTRIWLGSYSSPEAAARAYDAALLCLKGCSASLNFPDSAHFNSPPSFMSPKSIQRFAASAANATNLESVSTTEVPTVLTTNASSPSSDTITNLMEEEPIESWVHKFGVFESPNYMNQMMNHHWITMDSIIECDEYEVDIGLWNF